jgi:hypothetical protein
LINLKTTKAIHQGFPASRPTAERYRSTKVPELAPSSLTLNTSLAQASSAAFLLIGPGVFIAKLEKSLNLSVDNNFQKNCFT